MEERVHPIPFRTRKLSSPSPMILHNVMWESRPLSTIAPKPLAATSARGFVFCICCGRMPHPPLPAFHSACPCAPSHFSPLFILPFIHPSFTPSFLSGYFLVFNIPWFLLRLRFLLSPSTAFTQTRLLRPQCVSAGILMLTYLSTLRSKSRHFFFRTKNVLFANSPNACTSPPPPLRRV